MRKILLVAVLVGAVTACVGPTLPAAEMQCSNQPIQAPVTLKFIPTVQSDGSEAPGRGTIITVQDRFLDPHSNVLTIPVLDKKGEPAFNVRYSWAPGVCFTFVDSLHVRDWYTVNP
jgi:hypothetical protein